MRIDAKRKVPSNRYFKLIPSSLMFPGDCRIYWRKNLLFNWDCTKFNRYQAMIFGANDTILLYQQRVSFKLRELL